MIAARDARTAELEKLLGESRRGGKRQAALFSKGDPELEPRRPGRKRGGARGRHAHRLAPAHADRIVDARLAQVCPCCGGDIEIERVAEQWQTELPGRTPEPCHHGRTRGGTPTHFNKPGDNLLTRT